MHLQRLPIVDAIDSGAEVVGCSQHTIQRYLRKLCSKAGMFKVTKEGDDRWIVFKDDYAITASSIPIAAPIPSSAIE